MIVSDRDSGVFNCCADLSLVCTGSRCMAWRWAQVKSPDWKPPTIGMAMVRGHPADEAPAWINSDTEGYCGLAGKP